jgi:succinate dehydrogenase / fumarate reductase membrane anchor subunit
VDDLPMIQQPLTKINRQGSAHTGVAHWKGQRLSAVALIFFCGWFLAEILSHTQMDHHAVQLWISKPWNGAALTLFTGLIFYHSALGLRVIIEDYIPNSFWQSTLIFLVKVANILLAILSWFFILRITILAIR